MRFLISILVLALVCSWAPFGRTGIVATAVVPGDGTLPRAVVHREGVTIPAAGALPLLACATLADGVDMAGLLWTGGDNLLTFGEDGPWLTDTDGCNWVATFGPASERRVVGAYQESPGDPRVLFAVGGDLGVSGVMVTQDGGFTSEVLAGLSFGELVPVGLAGNSGNVGLLGLRPDGTLRGWNSADGGLTFEEREMPPEPLDGQVQLGALSPDGMWWIWVDATLYRLPVEGGAIVEERVFSAGPAPTSGSPDGAIWVAAGDDGLWRRAPEGTWTRALVDTTTAVHADTGPCWSGHPAQAPGEPLVRWSNDGGATWSIAMEAPATWGYAAGCETMAGQVCAEDLTDVWPGEDAAEADGDAEDPGTSGGCALVVGPGGTCWGVLLPWLLLMFCRCGTISRNRWFVGTP